MYFGYVGKAYSKAESIQLVHASQSILPQFTRAFCKPIFPAVTFPYLWTTEKRQGIYNFNLFFVIYRPPIYQSSLNCAI